MLCRLRLGPRQSLQFQIPCYTSNMKLYLIPAYEETINDRGYRRIIKAAEEKGYSVEVLNLQIKNNSLSKLVSEAVAVIKKTPDCVVFGFSTGALIAYKISTLLKIEKGLFCSVSPILGTDIPKNAQLYTRLFGEDSLRELRRSDYGVSRAAQPIFFCGDKEGRKLISRTNELCQLSGGQTVVVKNNEHELNAAYVKEVIKFL